MSKKFELELNSAGIAELMRNEACQEMITEKTNEVMSRLDPQYYEADVQTNIRTVGMVKTSSYEGYYHELKHNNILKALR